MLNWYYSEWQGSIENQKINFPFPIENKFIQSIAYEKAHNRQCTIRSKCCQADQLTQDKGWELRSRNKEKEKKNRTNPRLHHEVSA